MSITCEEFMAKTGAKKVAGQYILGDIGKRFVAATRKEGVFSLTPEGEEYLAKLGTPEPQAPAIEEKPKRGRKKKEVVEEVSVDEDFEALLAEDE
jgi:DNA-binding PadR family transcriptional regulator